MLYHTYTDKGLPDTVVLVHGILGKSEQLASMQDLPANILSVDLPGHGKSPSVKKQLLETAAKELKNVLKKYNITQPILIGYSLGGFVVQELVRQGAAPKGIVFIATASRLPQKSLLNKYDVLTPAHRLADKYGELIARIVDRYRALRGKHYVIAGEVDLHEALRYVDELAHRTYDDTTKTIIAPTLILHGTLDIIVPLAEGKHLQQLIAGSTLVEVRADHIAILELQKTKVQIKRFLKTL